MNLTNKEIIHKFFHRRYGHRRYRSWTAYASKAEVIWRGTNYILLRTGMSPSRSRYVYLVDKAGLLYDEDAPALVQLSCATHAAQSERNENPELLHESNKDYSQEPLFKGRWCKAMKANCIAYAEKRDACYEHELPRWIEEYEQKQAEEKDLDQQERDFAARVARFMRKEAHALGKRLDRSLEAGAYADRSLTTNVGTLSAFVSPSDWTIRVSRSTFDLTESQFRRLTKMICRFHRENEAREQDEDSD